MKIGDLVKRTHLWEHIEYSPKYIEGGVGIVVSLHMGGEPAHPCATVFYPKINKKYDIAVSLLRVVSESR